MLVEGIIGHQRELQAVIHHRIAQGEIEIAVAIGHRQTGIIGEPVLIAGVQQ